MLALCLAVFALTVAQVTGVLGPFDPSLDADRLRAVALAILFPTLVEELIFRWPVVRWRRPGVAIASFAVFIAWHPIGAALVPDLAVIGEPAFVVIVAVLGAACTLSAWRARSIWPSVALHWGVVSGWILLYGGP